MNKYSGDIVEVFFVDLEVPHIRAVPAPVGHYVTWLPAKLRRREGLAVADTSAIHANDGVGDGHTCQRGITG
jgi:hypothetical protein